MAFFLATGKKIILRVAKSAEKVKNNHENLVKNKKVY